LPAEEFNSLWVLLTERKEKIENEEAESHTEVLLDFLHRSQLRKEEKMNEVSAPFFSFFLVLVNFSMFNRGHVRTRSSPWI